MCDSLGYRDSGANLNKIYVVSGTHQEYFHFAKNKLKQLWDNHNDGVLEFNLSMSNFVYVRGVETLRGLENVHGFFCGSFRNRPDLRDIIRQIRVTNRLDEGHQIIPDLFVGRGLHKTLANPTRLP